MINAPPIIEIAGITKRFPGVLALDRVGFDFRSGEVHAVVGENGAGKSTLMNVLAGTLQPDSGDIVVDGVPTKIRSPLVSQQLGIRVVYQELSLCGNLTVAENVMLPSLAQGRAMLPVPRAQVRGEARRTLAALGIADIDVDARVGGLSVAEMQLVEIARAISQKARVVVLDEPNSALSRRESEKLFDIVRQLRKDGVTVLYVSHHLEEVLNLADRISVMRDGKSVETLDNDDVTEDRLISAMVGRNLSVAAKWATQEAASAEGRPAVLEVRDLRSSSELRGVSFTVRAGEIVGVGGLPDSGKDVLPDALFGLRERSGDVTVDGTVIRGGHPAGSIRAGMALIPADRRGAGALLSMSVSQNVVSAALPRFSRFGFLRRGRIRRAARAQVARLDARVASLTQRISTLSGGNQQKIILSRGLVTNPRVLILHEPTRGIDVGAKAEIYEILKGIAGEGVAVLIVSSELTELIGHTARVLVMRDGRVAGELSGEEITEEAILARALAS